MGTAIYLLTNHISEVQYNNWGNGVWNNLLTIQGTGNCNNNSKTDEDHKKCIQDDINTYYDLENIWSNNYWETWYNGKLKNTTDGNKFQKLGSWKNFRDLCTKGINELIKKSNWEQLSKAIGPTSASTSNPILNSDIVYENCLKAKSTTKR